MKSSFPSYLFAFIYSKCHRLSLSLALLILCVFLIFIILSVVRNIQRLAPMWFNKSFDRFWKFSKIANVKSCNFSKNFIFSWIGLIYNFSMILNTTLILYRLDSVKFWEFSKVPPIFRITVAYLLLELNPLASLYSIHLYVSVSSSSFPLVSRCTPFCRCRLQEILESFSIVFDSSKLWFTQIT